MKKSIDQALFRAQQHRSAGDVDSALKIYENLLLKFKNNKKLRSRLLDLINSAKSENDNMSANWWERDQHQKLVDMYLAGEFSSLVKELNRLVKSHPGSCELWNMLGMALEGNLDITGATQAFQKAASLCPRNADVLLNLALSLRKAGDSAGCGEVLSALVQADSKKRSTFNHAGVLLYQRNSMQLAEMAFNRALQLDPHYADAYSNLGIVMSAQGHHSSAIDNFQSAIAAEPNAPEGYNNFGNALRRCGKIADSVIYFERAISLRPDYSDALYNLGLALHHMEKFDAAIAKFEEALTVSSHAPKVHDALATTLQITGRLAESKRHYEVALEQDEDFHQAHNNLGALLQKTGDVDGAIIHFNKAVELFPSYADALNNLGTALMESGDSERAKTLFAAAISHDPRQFDAIRNLAAMKGSHISQDLFTSITTMYEETNLANAEKAKLGYALFSIYKKERNYDEAFKYLKTANQARKQALQYNLQRDLELYTQLLQAPLSWPNLKATSFAEAPGIPIFICGMPRSGTTLVEHILSSHSEITAGGELRHIGVICKDNKDVNTSGGEFLQSFRDKYFRACQSSLYGTKYFTDKMPHNFLYIPQIVSAFPEARVVHVFRTPEATCWSNFETYFSTNGLGYSYDLNDLVAYQNLYVELMNRYAEIYKCRICHVDYDSLTDQQDTTIRSLFDALNIPFERASLQPHLNNRPVATASNEQVRQPIYKGSSQQWRKFERHTVDYFSSLKCFTPPQ